MFVYEDVAVIGKRFYFFLISRHSIYVSLCPQTKKRKNAVVLSKEVIDSLLVVERHPGTGNRSPSTRSTTEVRPLILAVNLASRFSEFPVFRSQMKTTYLMRISQNTLLKAQFLCHPVN